MKELVVLGHKKRKKKDLSKEERRSRYFRGKKKKYTKTYQSYQGKEE